MYIYIYIYITRVPLPLPQAVAAGGPARSGGRPAILSENAPALRWLPGAGDRSEVAVFIRKGDDAVGSPHRAQCFRFSSLSYS